MSSEWTPDPRRMHIERDAKGKVTQLRHGRHPYRGTIAAGASGRDELAAVLTIATAYVKAANVLLKLPDDLLPVPPDARGPTSQVVWAVGDDLRDSFELDRYENPQSAGSSVIDRTLVLLASFGFCDEKTFKPFYGSQGMQVLAHLAAGTGGATEVRITSVSHTLPQLHKTALAKLQSFLQSELEDVLAGGSTEFGFLALYHKQYAALFGLETGSVPVETGVMLLPADGAGFPVVIVNKTAPPAKKNAGEPGASMPPSTFRVAARLSVKFDFEPVFKFPMVSHAHADVLARDPVTQAGPTVFKATRPHRAEPAFATYVSTVQLWNASIAPNGRTWLKDTSGYFEVKPSAFVNDTSHNGAVTVPSPSQASARSDEFAAVNAYVRTADFIQRLLACGLDPKAVLRYITWPLSVRYRGGIHPGHMDGQTVNAQVRWLIPPTSQKDAAQPGTAEISLALADLRLNPKRVPLGIATDQRWAWHEWSHVMLAGATGLLEFQFAHSAGDALAAIISDPDSALAGDAKWRGITFPWVTVPDRHHDRDVGKGWSWAGWFNQRERDFAQQQGVCDKSPYWSEQLQSSSLFNMYRSLGGDAMTDGAGPPEPDRKYRRAIGDFSAYLILRGIASMGSASTHVIDTPDKFVKVLDDADLATQTFTTNGMTFIGGAAGKVIRWAYQNQGLYPDPALPLPTNAPGRPEEVDLYIEDKASRKGS